MTTVRLANTVSLFSIVFGLALADAGCGDGTTSNAGGAGAGGAATQASSNAATTAASTGADAATTTTSSAATGGGATDAAIEAALAAAAEGLLYTSESDYPFEVVTGPVGDGAPVDEATVRAAFASYVDGKVDADKPLASLSAMEKPWSEWKALAHHCGDPNDAIEVAQCAKMKALEAALDAELTNLHVFYFGSVGMPGAVDGIGVSIFLVGRTPSGKLMGVATLAIWT